MLFSIVILVILIGINAFFASSEIAFISLNDALGLQLLDVA